MLFLYVVFSDDQKNDQEYFSDFFQAYESYDIRKTTNNTMFLQTYANENGIYIFCEEIHGALVPEEN